MERSVEREVFDTSFEYEPDILSPPINPPVSRVYDKTPATKQQVFQNKRKPAFQLDSWHYISFVFVLVAFFVVYKINT